MLNIFNYITEASEPLGHKGIRLVFKFDNGYGASVIKHCHSYGGTEGLWEIAVLDSNNDLCYSTHITDNVLGHLTPKRVQSTLESIAKI